MLAYRVNGLLFRSKENVSLRRKLIGFVLSRYVSPRWDLQDLHEVHMYIEHTCTVTN